MAGNKKDALKAFEEIKKEMVKSRMRKTEKKKIVCPKCGGEDVAHILYGFPLYDEALKNALEKGEIHLGGCCIDPDSPAYHCNECDEEFGIYDDR